MNFMSNHIRQVALKEFQECNFLHTMIFDVWLDKQKSVGLYWGA